MLLLLLLLALALAAHAAIPPRRGWTPALPAPRLVPVARVAEQSIDRCVPKSDAHLVGVTPDVQCPCLVRFSVTVSAKGRRAAGRSVDFLIINSVEAKKVRASETGTIVSVPKYSIKNVKPNRLNKKGQFSFESPGFEIADKAKFALVLRMKTPARECGLRISYVLEGVPKECPVRLRAPKPSNPVQGRADAGVSHRVVGGFDPGLRQKEFMVAFARSNAIFCSGTIIADRWVLTAAHCRLRPGDKAFVSGLKGFSGAERSVSEVKIHPQFDTSKMNGPFDVALVRLSGEPVSEAVPVTINSKASLPAEMSYVRVAGYGRISENFAAAEPPALRTVDLPVVPIDQCADSYGSGMVELPLPLNRDVQVCAGYSDGACDACQGDSGGPVTVYDAAGSPVLVGVVSFGMGCARGGIPGVYTRVAPFVQWIQSTVGTISLSTSGVVVRADTLEAGLNKNAPTSGTGIDGIDPDAVKAKQSDTFSGESRIVSLLRVTVPAVIAGVTIMFFLCACCLCFCCSHWRERTMSDHATGLRTKTIDEVDSDVEHGVSSYGAPSSQAGTGSVPASPGARPTTGPAMYVAPKKKFSLRKTRPEIIRMPDVAGGTEEDSGLAVAGSRERTGDNGVGGVAVQSADSADVLGPSGRAARRSGRAVETPGSMEGAPGGEYERAYPVYEGGVPGAGYPEYAEEPRSFEVPPRGARGRGYPEQGELPGGVHPEYAEQPRSLESPQRDTRGRPYPVPAGGLPGSIHPEYADQPQSFQTPPRAAREPAHPSQTDHYPGAVYVDEETEDAHMSKEEMEELGRRQRNAFFDERYPTTGSSSNFLMPSFDDVVPERTTSRPDMTFREELHEQKFNQ